MNIKRLLYFPALLCLIISAGNTFSQSILDNSWNFSSVDTSITRSIDYTTDSNFVQLVTGEQENLARNRFAYLVYQGTPPLDTVRTRAQNIIDGNYSTFIEIGSQRNNNNSYLIIDLEAFRSINRIKIFTSGLNRNLRPAAFAIYAGEDTITMEKVYENLNNDTTIVNAQFNPITSRYIRIIFNVIQPNFSTVISEVEVYGLGYLPEGTFGSSVKDAGSRVNFGTFEFGGEVPAGTSAEFGFRTGDVDTINSSWSDWSEYNPLSNSLFSVDEPRRYIQYRIRLRTSNLQTPRIDFLQINFDSAKIISNSSASISPQFAPILKENDFALIAEMEINPGDRGVDTLKINTPSPAEILGINVNGSPASYLADVDANQIIIAFNSTISSTSTVEIRIRTTPFLGVSPYQMEVSSSQVVNNPQKLDASATDNVEAWSIVTVGVPERLIINSEAEPNPFSPNGDGRNDVTSFRFFLGNIGEPNNAIGAQVRTLKINIYDLTGRLVRELYNSNTRAAAFISSNAIEWDGRDQHGKIVRPGVYVYQISVDSDNGGEYESKTIVVSY